MRTKTSSSQSVDCVSRQSTDKLSILPCRSVISHCTGSCCSPVVATSPRRATDRFLRMTTLISIVLSGVIYYSLSTAAARTRSAAGNSRQSIATWWPGSTASNKCIDSQLNFLPYQDPGMIDNARSHLYVEDALNRLVNKIHVNCTQWVRLGATDDGGWDMCIAGHYRPVIRNCLVYSFGIGYDFSFDDEVAGKFGCTVRSFDPSMTIETYRRSRNVWFYNVGLDGKDYTNEAGWELKTLASLVKQYNDTGVTIDYLKLDIEGFEWPAIIEMLESGILSSTVRQLAVEVHFGSGRSSKPQLEESWNVLVALEKAGFRRWSHRNNAVALVYREYNKLYKFAQHELVYINTKFA